MPLKAGVCNALHMLHLLLQLAALPPAVLLLCQCFPLSSPFMLLVIELILSLMLVCSSWYSRCLCHSSRFTLYSPVCLKQPEAGAGVGQERQGMCQH